ncbi:HIT domain-containing protein [Isoptericola sp. b441]|uniref:HIT domain-containing protein n=1 Tax=Actinotalea lenta TaxID=3064654 RepID=A0ABT9DEK0_9CELL|nr:MULTISPECIES: HIT domain-containing protein [unclassified Isoptericola]MDO8107833.1 HIT domain-containing protein [Isoptericola sp. b441]MDO8120496.1 HIT domain-containing protein [Isoptericola sp. b490]
MVDDSSGQPADPAEGLAGTPDGFERLWTPHRMVYIQGQDKPAGPQAELCPFCRAAAAADTDGLVVARGETVFALLNLYPYNSGHLMVVPVRHVSDALDLTEDEAAELSAMTRTAIGVLRDVMAPQGFNLGMNLGQVAGAGIAAHLHQHVVPRWTGDANFLPIVGRTKALPELLGDTRDRLAAAWPGR